MALTNGEILGVEINNYEDYLKAANYLVGVFAAEAEFNPNSQISYLAALLQDSSMDLWDHMNDSRQSLRGSHADNMRFSYGRMAEKFAADRYEEDTNDNLSAVQSGFTGFFLDVAINVAIIDATKKENRSIKK